MIKARDANKNALYSLRLQLERDLNLATQHGKFCLIRAELSEYEQQLLKEHDYSFEFQEIADMDESGSFKTTAWVIKW